MMNSNQQRQLSLSRFWVILTIWWGVGLFACASQDLVLTGSWVSAEMTHPSPFFTETLGDDRHKPITLIFDQAGGFVWLAPQEVCHFGTYRVQDHTLLLTEPEGETVILRYAFIGHQLQLKSPDGFMFDFRKVPHQADADAKPCKR
ncbi:MAG TPA: hypothetical protein PKM72_09220 [Nitrospirales bacterium]|nr:hypothetical protein [Nitrospirales bacterium]